MHWLITLTAITMMARVALAQPPCVPAPVEGFGTQTRGGEGQPVVHVTSLADSGPGSLRAALSAGNRCVTFTVSGTIPLRSAITIRDSFVTIDGFAAPGVVTISGHGLLMPGPADPYLSGQAHDIIIRGLRFTPEDNATGEDIDTIGVYYGAYNVVIERNTFVGPAADPYGASDEHMDFALDAHDATVAWNVILRRAGGGTTQNVLVNSRTTRISLHHNLLSESTDKNPMIVYDIHSMADDTDTTVDFRNNVVVAKNGGEGADFGDGARVNIVNNYFAYLPMERPPTDAYRLLVVCNKARSEALGNPPYVTQWCMSMGAPTNKRHDAYAYVAGNITPETIPAGYPTDLNAWSTQKAPFPAPAVTTTDATTAACQVLAQAGRRPLQAQEQQLLARVTAPASCGVSPPHVEAPRLFRYRP